jgi:dolichyl-phosphate beta-glucosyltransferase
MLIQKLLRRPAIQQFIKYVIVGTIVTLIDMAALHVFYHILHINIKISVILGFMCGNVSSFILNKYFTFRNFSASILRQYSKYFVTSMSGLTWTVFLMFLFYEKLGLFGGISSYNYLLCKMLVAVLVMFWNFMIIRNWTLANYELGALHSFAKSGSSNPVFLSVIIPAYNEAARLPATLEQVIFWLKKQEFSWEIIVVDDGSDDNMAEIIKSRYAVEPDLRMHSLGKNSGKGAAVKAGMLMASGEYRLFMDADHQINIGELENFLPLVQENLIIIGSKYIKSKHNIENIVDTLTPNASKTDEASVSTAQDVFKISFVRRLISRIGNLLIRILLNLPFKDTQCGFKLFPGKVAENIFRLQKLNGFSFDVEVLVLAALFRVRVMEVPIVIHAVSESRVRTVRDSFKVFNDLVRIKFNIWKRVYSKQFAEQTGQ